MYTALPLIHCPENKYKYRRQSFRSHGGQIETQTGSRCGFSMTSKNLRSIDTGPEWYYRRRPAVFTFSIDARTGKTANRHFVKIITGAILKKENSNIRSAF